MAREPDIRPDETSITLPDVNVTPGEDAAAANTAGQGTGAPGIGEFQEASGAAPFQLLSEKLRGAPAGPPQRANEQPGAELAQPSSMPPVAEGVARQWLQAGYTPEQVAGMLGVMNVEAPGFNPTAINSESGAFGLYQHLGPRQASLFQFVGQDPALFTNPDAQTQFALQELQGDEAEADKYIRSAQTPEDAVRAYRSKFMRPGAVGPEYDAQAIALAHQLLPGVQGLHQQLLAVQPTPAPQQIGQKGPGGFIKLPDFNSMPPEPPQPGQSLTSGITTPEQRARFNASHSADLDPLREFGYQFGVHGLGTLGDLAGIPGNIEHLSEYLHGGAIGYKPFAFGSTGLFPTSSQLRGAIGSSIGYDYGNPPPTSDVGRLGAMAGDTVAGSLPFAAGGVAAGAAGLAPTLGRGLMGNSLRSAETEPLKYFLKEGLEFPTMAGLGAGEAGNIYRNATGSEGTTGEAASEIGGGLALSARIPPFAMATSMGARIFKNVLSKTWNAVRGRPNSFAADAGMTSEQAEQLMGQEIAGQFREALTDAQDRVADIGPRHPTTIGMSGAPLNARISDSLHDSIIQTNRDAAETERNMWAPPSAAGVPGVNLDLGRDYSKTLKLRSDMEAEFKRQSREENRSEDAYPKAIIDGIFGRPAKKATTGTITGLDPTTGAPIFEGGEPATGLFAAKSSLGTGQNTRSQLESAIRDEQAKLNPSRAVIGVLQKLSRSILSDMEDSGVGGTTPDEIKAYQNALGFSKQLANFRSTPEVADALAVNKAGTARVQAVQTMDRFLKEGSPGASAARTIADAAKMHYGPEGSQGMQGLVSDAIRQKFLEQVAPNGYVNMDAYRQFTSPTKFGPWLSRPEYSEVADQLKNAANGEQNALSALNLGKGRLTGSASTFTGDQIRDQQMHLWMDNPVEQVDRHLDRSPNQYRSAGEVFRQLDRDTTGAASDGFFRHLADRAVANGPDGLGKWADQNQGIVRAMSERDPGFESRLKDLSAVTGKGGARAFVTDLALRWAGAKAGGMTAHETGAGFVMAGAGSRAARKVFSALSDQVAQQLTGRILADPEAYNAFVRFSATGALKDMHILHAYVPGLPIGVLAQPDEQGPHQKTIGGGSS